MLKVLLKLAYDAKMIASNPQSNSSLAQRWFWFFIILHVLLWTLIPNFIRTALPMDAAEGVVWGQQLVWGYDRNPWLNAWLTRLAIELGGNSDIFIYFFSQLCVALAFWSVWQLGQKMLTSLQAVVAVLMLEAVQYYTLAAVDFNDNVLEIALWPLLVLLFYNALTTQRCRYWLGVGLVAGLALMTKYYSAIVFLAMFIFLLWNTEARESFKKSGLYWGLLLFIVIITPHIIWLFQHDFVTIHYALRRVNDNESVTLWHYLQPGLKYAAMQLLSFLCAVGLFCFASVGWAERSEAQQNPNKKIQIKKFGIGLFGFVGLRFAQSNLQDVSKFNSQFLWVVGVGPYIITVLMALAAGWQLHTLWGTPLLSCWGLLLIYLLQPNITRPQFYRFLVAVLVVFIIVISAYTFVMLKPNNKSSGNFPARNVAAQITQLWHAHYQQPLPYVIGDRVLASDVARYSVDKPRAHLGWDSGMNPWIDVATLKREGAIFVQRLDEGSDFPVSVREQFPGLKVVEIQDFGYVRATPDLSRIKIVVGILPPNS